jgi:hypothetical protein
MLRAWRPVSSLERNENRNEIAYAPIGATGDLEGQWYPLLTAKGGPGSNPGRPDEREEPIPSHRGGQVPDLM